MNFKRIGYILILVSFAVIGSDLQHSLAKITNFHFVSDKLASSGLLKLEDYNYIKEYGFKHVINLIPGDQVLERQKVESLGLTYQQIQVAWEEPTLDDFERFSKLMKSYNNEKIYVHCEANYRASTFIYLYRLIHLKENESKVKKDLLEVWKPSVTWQDFIEKTLFYTDSAS